MCWQNNDSRVHHSEERRPTFARGWAFLFACNLGLRASAFEKRIRRVVATGHAYDYYKIPPAIMQWMMTFFNTKFKDASNRITLKNIAKGGMEGWQTSNVMYITKIDVPMSAFDYAWQMNEKNLHYK